jgi:hypothetical protein
LAKSQNYKGLKNASSFWSNCVFVKLDKHVDLHGRDGSTAHACDPEDLRAEEER